ncbi:CU044_5270 family protein [Amnibacterium sp.]|uniref:CU044_5270 family protein n=1 Tax=Amnibacterium sp. TaxID=1872496 RepID=UPI003F7CC78D
MRDLTILRTIYDSQPTMDEASFKAVKARLLADFGAEPGATVRAREGRSRQIRIAGLVGVAAGLAVLVIAGTVFGFGGGSRPASAVTETLEQAAIDTIHVNDPRLVPGDYLHVRTEYIGSVSGSQSGGPVLAWQIRGTDDEWVPADPSAEWVQRRGVGVPFAYFSAAAKRAAQSGEYQVDDGPVVQRGRNGVFAPTGGGSAAPWTPASLKALPTDTDALLTALAHRISTSRSNHDAMFEALTEILDTGFAPAATRAAVFRAIATLPGIRITDRSANLDGRTGIAIGRTDATLGVRLDLVIDAHDGVVIGTRRVLTRAARGMPAGTVESLTAVTTTVDHAAPHLR